MLGLHKTAAVVAIALAAAGCSRTPEEKCSRYLASGKKYLEKKDYQRAALEFKNATQANPKNPEPYYQLSLALLATGDMRNAVGLLRKTTELNPKHNAAQLKLAQLMTSSQSKEVLAEAEKRVREVLANSPADADALNTLAAAEWRLGKQEEAEDHLEEALATSPQNLNSALSLARVKLSQKDLAGAEEVLKKAVAASPKSMPALVALGAFYVLAARPDEAEKQYRRAIELDSKNGLPLVSLAGIKLRAGLRDEAEQLYKQAAALPDPRYQPVYGIYLFQSGKRDLAVAEFEKLAKAAPGNRAFRSRLVAAYLAANRLGDAQRMLDQAIEKNGKDLEALLQRSRTYLLADKYTEAEADLTKVVHFEPKSAMAHYLLAQVHRGKGARLRQREELGEAVRLAPGLLPARLELARLLTATNAAKTALDLLNATPEAQKNAPDVIAQQNWAYLNLGQKAEARAGIQRGLALARTPVLLVQDGIYKLMQHDYAGARQSAEEILQANPEDVRGLDILMQTYAALNQTPAGLQKIRDHAGRRPKSALLQAYLGQQLLRSGDRAGARTAFEAAKAANSKLAGVDLALAQIDTSEGKLDDARKRISAMISANPSHVAAHLLLAGINERAAKYADAVEGYRKVIGLDERNVLALNNLAFLMVEYGKQPDEALQLAEKARELAPGSAYVLDTLGWVYYRKSEYHKAIQYLEQAVSKEATGIRRMHLAMAHIKSGDRKRGLESMDAALKMDPQLQQSKLFQEVREMR